MIYDDKNERSASALNEQKKSNDTDKNREPLKNNYPPVEGGQANVKGPRPEEKIRIPDISPQDYERRTPGIPRPDDDILGVPGKGPLPEDLEGEDDEGGEENVTRRDEVPFFNPRPEEMPALKKHNLT